MSLKAIQAEVARLSMDGPALQAWLDDPKSYAKKAKLSPADAKVVAGIIPDGLAYFASRRRIDRAGYLRADMGRTVRLLERHGWLDLYFDDEPYAYEDPRPEVARFATWCKQAARKGCIPDHVGGLAAFEALAYKLLHTDHVAAKKGKNPKLAPGVVLLPMRHDFLGLIGEETVEACDRASVTAALQRTEDDVEVFRLDAVDVALLKGADGKRSEATLLEAVAAKSGCTTKQAKASLKEWRGLRLLS